MKIKVFILMVIAIVLLAGCATKPEEQAVDYSGESVLIQVKNPGISPGMGGLFDLAEFLIFTGEKYPTEKWALDIISEGGDSISKLSGIGQVPAKLSWDGINNAGSKAVDGRYKARISIWFPGAVSPITQETAVFLLDSQGPIGRITFSEGLFSPDDDGVNDILEIKVGVEDELSDVVGWTLSIYDSHGAEIKRFYSDQEQPGLIKWDGKTDGALMVSSASDYQIMLRSRDSLGNEGTVMSEFSTDILVIQEDNHLRIRVNSITFKGYTADFMDVEAEQRKSNLDTLDLLASKLKKFPGYKITLEGHAVSVFWNNPAKAAVENSEVLIPLSKERAEVIRDALQERGVTAAAMNIVGLGANRPIVPFSDLQNRWKNRRVVFILTK